MSVMLMFTTFTFTFTFTMFTMFTMFTRLMSGNRKEWLNPARISIHKSWRIV